MSTQEGRACDSELAGIIRRLSQRVEPVPTSLEPDLRPCPGVRAVLFDVYGTLFLSGSGDIGVLQAKATVAPMREALRSAGIESDGDRIGPVAQQYLVEEIEREHGARRRSGTEFPEIEIRDIWRRVLARLKDLGLVAGVVTDAWVERLAVEHECRANPVWPAPGLRAVLEDLRGRGIIMGVVSNAQFYTHLLFPALLGVPAETLGIDPGICVWSYREGEAKPSVHLFRQAAVSLHSTYGLDPAAALYVGNDMLNDLWPASQVGFRTALFAGDARSLRLRAEDSRCSHLKPGLTLTELAQLPRCLA